MGISGRAVAKHLKRLAIDLVGAGVLAGLAAGVPAFAQTTESVAGLTRVQDESPLLLQADELVYDRDRESVAAVGDVQLDYGGTRLVARRVIYNQRTARMVAIGNVEIVQPDGTRVFADEIDVTEDFADGFVNALRIVTPDKTYIAAENAVREGGTTTTFGHGVYTACEPCRERPEKPPLWQIKAQRVIWNGEEKTIRFEKASFEFFGMPIAYLPVFTTADPTVKRKTGFLMPGVRYSQELGFGLAIPYFIALAPNYDLKLTGTGFTRQGGLGEATFRHRTENGLYTITAAGIHQLTPEAFDPITQDSTHVNRAMIGTTGKFKINPRWTFGWDVLAQTDKNFSRTYDITGFSDLVQQNEVYLTGLGDRNFFDARVMQFDVQESDPDGAGRDAQQPWVLPSIDYNAVTSRPVAGGELAFNVNARGISRDIADQRGNPADSNFATRGLRGENGRITTEAEWRRTYIAPNGVALTPILAAQADANFLDTSTFPSYSATGAALTSDDTFYRSMVTAGMEVRWPILFSSTSSVHVLEPIAQVFARPDETGSGKLPNEDAQSFVFDTTTLFERDKFSGYDRIEGGHRANVGLRYTGTFNNGWTLFGTVGQSYNLGGENPFAAPDLLNVGAESGLETDQSDFVGMFGASYNNWLRAAVRARFDETTFENRRTETEAEIHTGRFTAGAEYAFVQAQPTYGFAADRHEVTTRASVRFGENWQAFGGATYDIVNDRFSRNGIGLAYDDECFSLTLRFDQSRDNSEVQSNSFAFRISLRTLGDFGSAGTDF